MLLCIQVMAVMLAPKSHQFLVGKNKEKQKDFLLNSNSILQKREHNNVHRSQVFTPNLLLNDNKIFIPKNKDNHTNSLAQFLDNSSFVIKTLYPTKGDHQFLFHNENKSLIRSKFNSDSVKTPNNPNAMARIAGADKTLNTKFGNLLNVTTASKGDTNVNIKERTKNNSLEEIFKSGNSNISVVLNNQINVTGNLANSSKATNGSINNELSNAVDEGINKNNGKTSHPSPPSLSRKNAAIVVILAFCVVIAITINFINLSSDYDDLMDFYRGFMGRRLLIVEGRLTSKRHVLRLKAEEQLRMDHGPQVINKSTNLVIV